MIEKDQEELVESAKRVLHSLMSAASEILGTDRELVDKYFKCLAVHSQKGNEATIIIQETASNLKQSTYVSLEHARSDTDRDYYPRLKELVRKASPFIPSEEKKIPKDEWPEPTWQPLEEENKED